MLGSSEKHHRPPTSERFSKVATVSPNSSMYLHAINPDQPAPMTVTSWNIESDSDMMMILLCKEERQFLSDYFGLNVQNQMVLSSN